MHVTMGVIDGSYSIPPMGYWGCHGFRLLPGVVEIKTSGACIDEVSLHAHGCSLAELEERAGVCDLLTVDFDVMGFFMKH